MKPNVRRQSRSLAVQGIYSWQVSQNPIADIEQQLLLENNVKHLDVPYFQDILRGVVLHHSKLDEAIKPFLERPFEDIDLVEKAVLRVSAYELKYRLDVPIRLSLMRLSNWLKPSPRMTATNSSMVSWTKPSGYYDQHNLLYGGRRKSAF